jgi:hypothetical protein
VRKTRQGRLIGIECPNEDDRAAIGFHVGRMRWRPADPPNEMRNSLRSFIESDRNARSDRNRDGNGPDQRMLRYRTASTSGAAVRVEGDTTSMKPDQDAKIDFSSPATLKKWPSVNKERVSAGLGARPYTIIAGTLDECIRKFMSQPVSQHHLYEIHTAPQSDLVSAILSADHVVELARPRYFLGN